MPAKKSSSGCEGYCVKCKKKQMMKDCKEGTIANGRAVMRGVCGKCGTKMNKFISSSK
jgi:hypothetical protein